MQQTCELLIAVININAMLRLCILNVFCLSLHKLIKLIMGHVLCTKHVCILQVGYNHNYRGVFQIELLGTDRLKTCTAVVLSCEQGMVLSHFKVSSVTHSILSMMDAISKIMIGRLTMPSHESTVLLTASCVMSKLAGH